MEEIKLASVKFKSAGKIYYFSTNLKLKKDDRVVVETARGLELGPQKILLMQFQF